MEQMTIYMGTKMIRATPMNRKDYNDFRGWTVPADEDPQDEGYLVEYMDGGKANTHLEGYVSWSPVVVFERAYRSSGQMTFGMAVEAIKSGMKMARRGWNGKGMWIGLHKEDGEFVREECGTTMTYRDYITMKTVDNQLVPWVASQTDILAEDWEVVQ